MSCGLLVEFVEDLGSKAGRAFAGVLENGGDLVAEHLGLCELKEEVLKVVTGRHCADLSCVHQLLSIHISPLCGQQSPNLGQLAHCVDEMGLDTVVEEFDGVEHQLHWTHVLQLLRISRSPDDSMAKGELTRHLISEGGGMDLGKAVDAIVIEIDNHAVGSFAGFELFRVEGTHSHNEGHRRVEDLLKELWQDRHETADPGVRLEEGND